MRLLFNSPFCRMHEAPHTEILYFADKKKEVDDAVLDYAFANVTRTIENTSYTREKFETASSALHSLASANMPCELEVALLPEEYIDSKLVYREETMLLEITPEDSKKLHFYDKYVAEVIFDLPSFCPTDEGSANYIFTINPKALELFAQDVLNLCSSDIYSAYYNTHVVNPEDDNPTLLIPLLWTQVYPVTTMNGWETDKGIRYTLMRLTPEKTFKCFPSRVMT